MVRSWCVLGLSACLVLGACDDGTKSRLQQEKESLIAQVDALKKQLGDVAGTVDSAGGALTSAQSEVARLMKVLEDREELVAGLQGQLDGLTKDLGARIEQITGLEGRLGSLTTDLEGRLGQITSLEGQLGTLQTDLAGSLRQLGDANGLVSTLRVEVARLTAALTTKPGAGNPLDALRGLIPGAKPPVEPAKNDPPPM